MDKKEERIGVFEGADLYRLSSFLDSLNTSQVIQEQKDQFSKNWSKIDTYHHMLNKYIISKEQYDKIVHINAKEPTFIGILLEGLYYKQQNIHPERIKTIKEYLMGAKKQARGFFDYQQKYITSL